MHGDSMKNDEIESNETQSFDQDDVDFELELERELNALDTDCDGYSNGVGESQIGAQLVITYGGQAYCFDNVTQEKVQDALYVLGLSGPWFGDKKAGVNPQKHKRKGELPGRCSQLERLASLKRFHQKRMNRCFEKKIRYDVRQEVAHGIQRFKGKFTKKMVTDNTQGQDSGGYNICTHCGYDPNSSSYTRMMRPGPAGPKTLCNACGIYWRKRGRLPVLKQW